MADEPTRAQHPGRRSSSADAAATRWGQQHPDQDVEHEPPSSAADSDGGAPGRHSASADAAALRWRERHPDDDTD